MHVTIFHQTIIQVLKFPGLREYSLPCQARVLKYYSHNVSYHLLYLATPSMLVKKTVFKVGHFQLTRGGHFPKRGQFNEARLAVITSQSLNWTRK